MAESEPNIPSVNGWLEDELYHQYLYDRKTVDPTWTKVFEAHGHGAAALPEGPGNGATKSAGLGNGTPGNGTPGNGAPANGTGANGAPQHGNGSYENAAGTNAATVPQAALTAPAPATPPMAEGDQLIPLRGPALRIAENMTASLTMPVATSQRMMPVKVIDENRRTINEYRSGLGQSKVSYTHLVAWAIVRAIEKVPSLNQAFSEQGENSFRLTHEHVNLGLAIDVEGKDGARSLKVPSLKKADTMNFAQFLAAYDDLVKRARANKLLVPDFEGTTISLTNPGTVGTVGSIPRLMPGQGAIIATGAIDYPPEYRGVPEDTRASMGLSKVMMVTCTYDHRVIQGAESGMFLARLQALLEGEDGFYTQIFADLGIPLQPWTWQPDQAAAPLVNADPMKQAAVARLIQAWRERGHLVSSLDPLGSTRPPQPDLDPSSHGLTIWDLDRTFHAGSFGVVTLRALVDRLRSTYAGTMGTQYMHIDNPEERRWLQDRLESTASQWPLDAGVRRRILQNVIEADSFETFLDVRFKGHKRFSIEGGESSIAMIEELLERAGSAGVNECVIGMAHRGRLSMLANVVGKSTVQLFSEFEGQIDPDSFQGSGDVKYHLGASGVRKTASGKEITVSIAFNPSHLEAVNPVVEGLVRPKQDRLKDEERARVIPILIHGDAAMSGQGIVAEVLNYSEIDGYDTGGTVHLVIDNQIGFTTNPTASRSSTYCSDVALMVQSPIFHVNGGDPEACVRMTQLAYDYRQRFHRDVVLAHGVLSQMGAQRRRRSKLHAADSVSQDPRAQVGRRNLRGAISAGGCRFRGGSDRVERRAEEAPGRYVSAGAGKQAAIRDPGAERDSDRSDPAESAGEAGGSRGDRKDRGSADLVPGDVPPASQARGVHSQASRGDRPSKARPGDDRLGHGGNARLRQPGARRHAGAVERPGQRPRHIQPAARGISRFGKRSGLRSAAASGSGAGALRGVQQSVERVRRSRIRIRL